jgi:UDP-glucose 4-epimerase
MKILTTGAAGRLGRSFERRIRGSGDQRSIFLRNRGPANGTSDPLRVDVTDRASLFAAISRTQPDVIVHLASLAGAVSDDDPERTRAVNVDSVRYVAEAAEELGVQRIVFASSGSIYGDRYSTPIDENGQLNPGSRYANSKALAEEVLRDAARSQGNLEVVILRIFNIYGQDFDQSLVSRLWNSSPANPVPLRAMNDFVRDYSHVSTVVSAIEASTSAILEKRESIFNIGSGIPITSARLVETLATARPISYAAETGAASYSCADIALASAQLSLASSPPTPQTLRLIGA